MCVDLLVKIKLGVKKRLFTLFTRDSRQKERHHRHVPCGDAVGRRMSSFKTFSSAQALYGDEEVAVEC